MWTTITRQDLRRAEGELLFDYFEMDLRHAEELDALRSRHKQERRELDARMTDLAAFRSKVEAFIQEYGPDAQTPPADDENATWGKSQIAA